jgi:hypothetical protein
MATRSAASVRALPGRLSGLSVFLCKSVLYGAFVSVRGALNRPKRRFSARAVIKCFSSLVIVLCMLATAGCAFLATSLKYKGPEGASHSPRGVGPSCATRPRHESFGRDLPIRPKLRHQYSLLIC